MDYKDFCKKCSFNKTDLCNECKVYLSKGSIDTPPSLYIENDEKPEPCPKEKRRFILEDAIKCVCTDRNEQYGEPEDNFKVIAELWATYLHARCPSPDTYISITADDVAMMMILFKVARAATANTVTRDTLVDIAGYAACAGGKL